MKKNTNIFRIVIAVLALGFMYASQNPAVADFINKVEAIFGLAPVEGLEGPVSLVRITDGDTIVVRLDGKDEKLRLIGIDTPEKYDGDKLARKSRELGISQNAIKQMGRNSSKFTERLLKGQQLYLEYDVTERDRYGRLLAYVYLKDDNGDWVFNDTKFIQVNLEIVKAGWAEPLTIPPNVSYSKKYAEANRNAKRSRLGNWAEQ